MWAKSLRSLPGYPHGVSLREEKETGMQPLVTLYERETVSPDTLTPLLTTLYDGGFVVPERATAERPYVIANFVETLDGVVSYNAPGQLGGGAISGNNEQDKMVMGLLRARADAVIFGSSSLRADSPHVRIPSSITPTLATDYNTYRQRLGSSEQLPMSVIVTASGQIDLQEPTFHTQGLRAIIATTEQGYALLAQRELPSSTEVRVIPSQADGSEKGVSPEGVLTLLAQEYGVRVALYEGGPTLLASFLATHVVDELFLTLAPQLAGRSAALHRLGLVEDRAFLPKEAPWATLLSVKLAGSHLLLRYRL